MIQVDVPESISLTCLRELLAIIGVTKLDDLAELVIDPRGMHATVYAKHPEHGGRYFTVSRAGDRRAAMHVLHIPIVD